MKQKKRSVISVGREGSEIKIYTLRTGSGYESYQCAWHDAGRRQTKTFGQMDAAKLFAQQKCVALANGLPEITSATLRDIEVFKSCETRVARVGLTVPAAIDEWLSARETLGPISLSEAVQFFMRHRAGITPIRLGDLVPLFLEAKQAANVSNIYLKVYRCQIQHFQKQFAATQISEITTPDIDRFLRMQTCSPVTKNNIRRNIVTLFTWAREQGYLQEDRKTAAEKAMTFLVPDQAPAIWTADEMRKLLKVCMPNLMPLLVIGAFSGIRSAEIDRLDWQDVLWEQGYIEIKAKKSKTKSRRLVPLRQNLKKWLEPYRQASGPVCQLSNHSLRLNYLGEKAGIGWRQNALRHSYASYRLAEIQDAAKVALELGNSPEKLFRHYRELVTPEAATAWFNIMPGA